MSLIQFNKGKVNKLHRKFLNSLKMEVGWRGTLVELKDRIIKIKSASRFTAREIRVLKRYLLKLANRTVSIEQVLEQFPGKTIKQINEFQNNNKRF